ncbi:MAG: DUF3822 family protein [Bacteroidota bacterium]
MNIEAKAHTHPYKKLSIQVSLNGLSFCVSDTIANTVIKTNKLEFKTTSTPYLLLKELKGLLRQEKLLNQEYEEVRVVHRNNLYSLVPKSLFDKDELPNYLKFNAKLLANDEIIYDELPNKEIVCVYVPFTNVNNYLLECFGEFEFKHNSIAMLDALFHQKSNKTICYAHVSNKFMELAVLEERKLVLYNQFDYKTKEDFLYYILFTYEQLGLHVEEIKLKLFGAVEEGDSIYNICYQYLKKVSVFIPKFGNCDLEGLNNSNIDLTLLGN